MVFKCNLSKLFEQFTENKIVFLLYVNYASNFLVKKEYRVEEACNWEGFSLSYTGRIVLIVSY